MAFLNNLDQIRNINWGKKYLWDIKFPTATPPFDSWFPASDIDVGEAILDTYSIEYYNRAFEVPMMAGQFELRVTFYDDSKFTLYKWLRNWVNNEILNFNQNNPWVSRLEESVKSVHLLKLNDQKEIIEPKAYLVYPKLTLSWEGTSVPDAQQYQVPFIIAGESPVSTT